MINLILNIKSVIKGRAPPHFVETPALYQTCVEFWEESRESSVEFHSLGHNQSNQPLFFFEIRVEPTPGMGLQGRVYFPPFSLPTCIHSASPGIRAAAWRAIGRACEESSRPWNLPTPLGQSFHPSDPRKGQLYAGEKMMVPFSKGNA